MHCMGVSIIICRQSVVQLGRWDAGEEGTVMWILPLVMQDHCFIMILSDIYFIETVENVASAA